MKTRIFTADEVKEAAKLIKNGDLVAFPTETVYGIGANALSSDAADKIFTAKGRPSDNPLIIHIASKSQLYDLVKIPKSKSDLVEKVIDSFWPGPLTIILHKKDIVPEHVTGGLDTVAVRMPKNKIALDLVKYSGVPIAAPSANISGRPSGTEFEHVFDDFDGRVAGIIKSSPSHIGIESTVIDLTTKHPILLRPGGVGFEELKKVIPDIKLNNSTNLKKVKSPGMKYKHYSPDSKIILFEKSAIGKLSIYKKDLESQGLKVKVINSENTINFSKKLFSLFRLSDKEHVDVILISAVDDEGIGRALMNRIRKAASEVVK